MRNGQRKPPPAAALHAGDCSAKGAGGAGRLEHQVRAGGAAARAPEPAAATAAPAAPCRCSTLVLANGSSRHSAPCPWPTQLALSNANSTCPMQGPRPGGAGVHRGHRVAQPSRVCQGAGGGAAGVHACRQRGWLVRLCVAGHIPGCCRRLTVAGARPLWRCAGIPRAARAACCGTTGSAACLEFNCLAQLTLCACSDAPSRSPNTTAQFLRRKWEWEQGYVLRKYLFAYQVGWGWLELRRAAAPNHSTACLHLL